MFELTYKITDLFAPTNSPIHHKYISHSIDEEWSEMNMDIVWQHIYRQDLGA